jgi:hypothetical protein
VDAGPRTLAAERARGVPSPVAIALARGRGRQLWADPAERAAATERVRPLAPHGDGLERLARRHILAGTARESLIWRPWTFDRAPLVGARELTAAAASGRGVLATFCHYGYFPAISCSLVRAGAPVHAVAGRWLFESPAGDARGDRIARWRSSVEEAGVELIDAEGCFDRIVALLRRGDVVSIAVDVPGSVPTPMLGLRARLTSGPARMAFEAGALVVPTLRPPVRRRPRTVAGAPLDARRFAGWRELHHAVAAAHDAWMRPAPWAHETPERLLRAWPNGRSQAPVESGR